MGNLVKDQQGEEGGDQQGGKSLGKGRPGIFAYERRRNSNFANNPYFVTNIVGHYFFILILLRKPMQNGLNDDADRDEVNEEEEEYFDDFDENDYMEEQHTNFPTFDDEENINHQTEEEEDDYLQSLQPLSQVRHRPSKLLGQNFIFTLYHISKKNTSLHQNPTTSRPMGLTNDSPSLTARMDRIEEVGL